MIIPTQNFYWVLVRGATKFLVRRKTLVDLTSMSSNQPIFTSEQDAEKFCERINYYQSREQKQVSLQACKAFLENYQLSATGA